MARVISLYESGVCGCRQSRAEPIVCQMSITPTQSGQGGGERRVQACMRVLQLLVFAADMDGREQYGRALAGHDGLMAALKKCEGSVDSRDLRTAVSGSWAGLSVSALAHVAIQKVRKFL